MTSGQAAALVWAADSIAALAFITAGCALCRALRYDQRQRYRHGPGRGQGRLYDQHCGISYFQASQFHQHMHDCHGVPLPRHLQGNGQEDTR